MSLRITPHPSHPTSTSNIKHSSQSLSKGAPSAPGLPDTLREPSQSQQSTNSNSSVVSSHPLESRLASWLSTQETLKHNMLRRTYGLGEPIRRGMELKMVRETDALRPAVLGRAGGVHEDILTGRDGEIGWEDVYGGDDGVRGVAAEREERGGGVLGDIERGVGMGKW